MIKCKADHTKTDMMYNRMNEQYKKLQFNNDQNYPEKSHKKSLQMKKETETRKENSAAKPLQIPPETHIFLNRFATTKVNVLRRGLCRMFQ